MVTIESIVRDHGKRLYNLAYRICGDEQFAEDLLQESLIEINRALPRFRGESSPYTWAYRITLKTSLRHLKKERTGDDARAALLLRDLFRFSYPKIAYILDVSEVVVRSRISRARAGLKRHFQKRCSWIDPANPCTCESRVGRALAKYPSLLSRLI